MHAGPRSAVAALFAILAFGPASADAREILSFGELRLDFSGSVREIVSYSRQTDAGDFTSLFQGDPSCFAPSSVAEFEGCAAWQVVGEQPAVQSLTRLRLRFDLSIASRWSAVLVWDNQLDLGQLDTLERQLGGSLSADTFLGAEGFWWETTHSSLYSSLYRGYLEYDGEHLDAVVGRQRIAWGVGRLWTPMDRFNFIAPLAVEGDQSPGVDSALARWSFDGFDFAEAVYAPGTSRDEMKAAGRLHGVFFDTDVSVMGGSFLDAPTAGIDFSRNLGPAAVWAEAVWTKPRLDVRPIGGAAPMPRDDYWQVVVGADLNIDFGTGVYALVEYLYNGNALGFGGGRGGTLTPFFAAQGAGIVGPEPALFGASQVVSGAAHQTGFGLGYDLTPELRLDVVTIADWNGPSAVLFPTLGWSPLDWLELRFGFQVGFGPNQSEYGAREELVYLLADLFF